MKTLVEIIQNKFFPWALLLIAMIVAGFLYQGNQNLKIKDRISEQNQTALTDSVKIVIDKKTGEMTASTAAFVANEKDLNVINKDLAERVKKEKGKVVSFSNANLILRQTNADLRKYIKVLENPVPPEKVNDSTYVIPWNLTYKYDSLNYDIFQGKSQIKIGLDPNPNNSFLVNHDWDLMTYRESMINLSFGQKVENKQLRIFVESNYPGLSVQSMKGVFIDPNTNKYIKQLMKKKHWFTGFGVGFSGTLGYNVFSGKPGLVLGPSIHYTLYNW